MANPVVTIEMENGGKIVAELYPEIAPETVNNFISLAKRYTDIQELTPELLRLFIRKIVVHEKDVKWSKHAQQTVEIHYNDIGCVELPQPKGQSTAKGA